MIRKLLSTFTTHKPTPEQLINLYNEQIKQHQSQQQPQNDEARTKAYHQELHKKLTQLEKEKELEQIKQYLLKNVSDRKEVEEEPAYIPNSLVIKKLKFGDRRVMLLGVEEQDEDHALYVKKLLEKAEVKVACTMIAPDLPYFIKTEGSFIQEWKNFIRNVRGEAKEARFYLSPSPQILGDLCLQHDKIGLVRNGLKHTKQFHQLYHSILQFNPNTNSYLPNALLAPLVSYGVEKVYFCEYPILKQRQLWAKTIPLDKLKQLFSIYKQNYKTNRLKHFDSRILFPDSSLSTKFSYICNIIKQASLTTNNMSVVICPSQYAELLTQQWKKPRPIQHYLTYEKKPKTENLTFMDFVQKLVILDIICEPVIRKYFINYASFPFVADDTLGGADHLGKVFIIWEHLYRQYSEQIYGSEQDYLSFLK